MVPTPSGIWGLELCSRHYEVVQKCASAKQYLRKTFKAAFACCRCVPLLHYPLLGTYLQRNTTRSVFPHLPQANQIIDLDIAISTFATSYFGFLSHEIPSAIVNTLVDENPPSEVCRALMSGFLYNLGASTFPPSRGWDLGEKGTRSKVMCYMRLEGAESREVNDLQSEVSLPSRDFVKKSW